MLTVTAVVPVRKPAPYLPQALDSLRRQTKPLDEILVVAHGWEPDPSDPMLRGVRVVTVSGDRTLADVRNHGLDEAHGDLVLLLDADDVAMPDRVAEQFGAFQAAPDLVLVCSAIALIDASGDEWGEAFIRDGSMIPAADLIARNQVAQSSVMMRRDVAVRAGGYRHLPLSEDYELWLRMRALGSFGYSRRPLTRYRMHDLQVTAGRRVPRRAWGSLLRARLDLAQASATPVAMAGLAHLRWCLVQALPRALGPRRYGGRWPHTTAVVVTGGLGNQMFQAAAALDLAHGSPVLLYPDLGGPRRHDGIHADVEALSWPDHVQIVHLGELNGLVPFARKAAGYVLRIGVIGNDLERRAWFRRLVAPAAALAIAPATRRRFSIRGARGIGYDADAVGGSGAVLLSGYFQTWRHVSAAHVMPHFRAALEGLEEEWFQEMRAVAEREQPIIVHVRLGDYRKEPGLGTIQPEYYAQALASARHALPDSRIWLFSDEPQAAIDMLPLGIPEPRVVDPPSPETHPAALLRVMTLGRHYILANSTFGWWAAMLARDGQCQVTVPDPWFVIGEQPLDLVPPQWQRRSRSDGHEVRP